MHLKNLYLQISNRTLPFLKINCDIAAYVCYCGTTFLKTTVLFTPHGMVLTDIFVVVQYVVLELTMSRCPYYKLNHQARGFILPLYYVIFSDFGFKLLKFILHYPKIVRIRKGRSNDDKNRNETFKMHFYANDLIKKATDK